ncbi:MAG: permease [Parcubacteria group bacterium CG08_land_8_20_14_0_20_48_21]|nr:MAG: permease [Parcubacteria group bacterium CG2_30_48_51]PIS32494.1 MAG: permease [Parcubacteria group bacterium CG08_land_8_20_14_0_20_48_21]PIW78842.1 MAG: permease [Parcubacteria group bacterium CG_4_8_14_3_um_filter_48_16]PIY78015.1 MAG: permease [Parcubacteria group bacterium CG_4_10_14_0_8_um_filter_48_154]PIZ77132.1 MAG: permease [bacterium CG_4_10_14_0_2_um_filter_48_144]PJC39793.1 MAG: permease [Parcubacteria group bacterium CG_4_9_14_0_2_um_filter_48_40]PJE52422.1 MAG: permease 
MITGLSIAILGAVLAVSLASIGSSIGVSIAGQVGSGILSEEPEKFISVLVLEALPGSQGIYGFVGAFMAINTITNLGEVSLGAGSAILFACLPIAIAGLFSGWLQGKVSVAGMNIVAKQPKDFVKAVVLSAMVETYAIIGLLTTILLLGKVS